MSPECLRGEYYDHTADIFRCYCKKLFGTLVLVNSFMIVSIRFPTIVVMIMVIYSTVKVSCLGVILCGMIIIMLIIIMIIIIPSLGIILCEMIARVDADPDTLPRTQVSSYLTFINVVIVIIIISFIKNISLQNFGVEYKAFSALCPECPPDFLKLAFSCVRFLPLSSSSFILSRFFNSSPIR